MNRYDSVLPGYIDNLVIRARALLPEVNVSDGDPITNNPGDYLGVGTVDLLQPDSSNSAETQQQRVGATKGSGRQEDGYLTCSAYAWHADATDDAMKVARDRVHAILAAIADELRDNPTLQTTFGDHGSRVHGLQWSEIETTQLTQSRVGGVHALLAFRIHYRARI